ncbi:elongation factor P [Candidatus Uhrbacteria bacterium RIFCSPHIGHO2_01_FULL_63_20]|uniref:Elongation factor P n=1 Tax=Candidatus Uhrbacteria bacterium RIFCSPHIGHO2_01_FULL_63_20 TaxID=1802385 RepID=A0A1F7TMU3_9BACT|nr:MAG: elongation factor P [Candidatus Uhrbacteria bacterium RIFCSPHIGHO2_01_FULL_63_20]
MSPNDIKKGTVIRYEGDLWIVMDFQRVSPGKGSSFVRTRMKNLKSGKMVENNFKSAENLDFEDVQYKKMQYLFTDGNLYTFMDNQSYEQVALSASDIGDDVKYLKEGIEVTILTYNDLPLTVQLPKKIQYTVKNTEPAVKGDTASGNVTKEAFMDNGLMVKVPIFVGEGDVIVVNTEDGAYSERVAG